MIRNHLKYQTFFPRNNSIRIPVLDIIGWFIPFVLLILMAFPSFHLLSLLDEVESYGNPLGLKTVECAGKAGDPVVFEMRSLTASHSDFHKARSSPEAWRHFMTLSYN